MIVAEVARAKVNLALHVLARREDGYHELDSIVAFADAGDELTFEPAESFELHVQGPFAAGLATGMDNLVMRAAVALAERWPGLIRPARMVLTKNLPIASGIGGGSADAAATLRGLVRLSGATTMTGPDLAEIALKLGADVPVCLPQRACRMGGIGEVLSPVSDFSALPALLVNPGVELATADVFRKLALARGARHSQPIASISEIALWRNDLEPSARAIAPVIVEVLHALQQAPGNRRAFMSGSGATCVGIFSSEEQALGAMSAMPPTWWSMATMLR